MAQSLYDILPAGVVARLLDADYTDNGNWIPVVNGVALPACTNVADAPVTASRNHIRTDSRKGPDHTLRSYNTNVYNLTLTFASEQPDIKDLCLGMGAERLGKTDWNADHTVGTLASPTGRDDALFGIFLATGAAPHSGQILPNTMPHMQYSTTKTTDYTVYVYNPTTHVWSDVTAGTSWLDAFNGHMRFSTILAAHEIEYDPANSGIITFSGGGAVNVDVVDPDLEPGDTACILALSYKYMQIANAQDFGYNQPLETEERVNLNLFRCKGDAPEGRIWVRRAYFDARQTMIPAANTSGSNEAANTNEYVFEIREQDCRVGSKDKYFAEMYYIEEISS